MIYFQKCENEGSEFLSSVRIHICKKIRKRQFLYSTVSGPLDRSESFTLFLGLAMEIFIENKKKLKVCEIGSENSWYKDIWERENL